MRTTAQIIDAFGGREAVAELVGAKPRTVEMWKRIGVPHKHFALLVAIARRRGMRGVTFETLYAAKAATLQYYRERAA
jgi:predicted RNA polymerase sigma factor